MENFSKLKIGEKFREKYENFPQKLRKEKWYLYNFRQNLGRKLRKYLIHFKSCVKFLINLKLNQMKLENIQKLRKWSKNWWNF